MEIKEKNIPWLDEKHPNFFRWKRARDISIERGKFVRSIIEQVISCNDLTILDLGSGEGGTSEILSKNNYVISFDLSKERLRRQSGHEKKTLRLCGNASNLPFTKNSFDVIIIQDVIEHVSDRSNFPETLNHLLKQNGIVYLSTPNKFSVFNFLSDPHWGAPIVSVLSRKKINKYFLRHFRKTEVGRKDIAELISLNDLQKLFAGKFTIELFTKYSVQELFNGNKGIVWSNFHLRLIKVVSVLRLDKLLIKVANNKPGMINKLLTPTFYLILKKK